MPRTVKRYLPDGTTRAVWDDAQMDRERKHDPTLHRASRIEVVDSGRFHVDFSPLADLTGDPAYRVCLRATFSRYGDANRAEVAWLHEHYILAGLRRPGG